MNGDTMTNKYGLQKKSKALTQKIRYYESKRWCTDKLLIAKNRIQTQIRNKRKDTTKQHERIKKLRE